MIEVSRARTSDVDGIRKLVDPQAGKRVLLAKETVSYYENLPEFRVCRNEAGEVVGCGALHVMWKDLAEVRTLTVREDQKGTGMGSAILRQLLEDAREIGVARVFCLTFETAFFGRHGFEPIDGIPVEPQVYAELLRSYDEGVAEFLDLERVKPNTLGNTRMLKVL